MQVAARRMIASVGSMILGSSRSSTRTSPGACSTTPRMRRAPHWCGASDGIRSRASTIRRPARRTEGVPGEGCTSRASLAGRAAPYPVRHGQTGRGAGVPHDAPRAAHAGQAGILGGGNRRVPGLRRSEVASLAGVSVEYYAKLERGDIAGASSSVLEAIAGALQLDDTERAHLADLARASDGIPVSGRARRRPARTGAPRPSLTWALEAITDAVAFVRNPRQDLLATNALGRAFYAPVIGDGGRTPNLARFQFLDPASHDFYPDWDRFAEMCVAIMRAEAGRDPHDRAMQDLVGELSHPQPPVPLPLGRARRAHPRLRHQALQPPRRRRGRARLRGARHHRRSRADPDDLHRRARLALRRAAEAAVVLGGVGAGRPEPRGLRADRSTREP